MLLLSVFTQRGLATIHTVGKEIRERCVQSHDDRYDVERAPKIEREAQSVGVGPGKHIGAQRGTEKTTESGHDLPQSVDLRSEVLVRAVRDENHAVGGGEGGQRCAKGYVTKKKRKHCAKP